MNGKRRIPQGGQPPLKGYNLRESEAASLLLIVKKKGKKKKRGGG